MHLDKKKIILGSLGLLFIAICILLFYIYSILCAVGVSTKSNQTHVEIQYNTSGKILYLMIKDYGLQLQHCRTVISSRPICEGGVPIDFEHDVILQDVDEVYYKKIEPDHLLILIPSYIDRNVTYSIDGITISTTNANRDSLQIIASQKDFQRISLYRNH